jgi:rare lipoprotein A (peptidoglycan hydrolase)
MSTTTTYRTVATALVAVAVSMHWGCASTPYTAQNIEEPRYDLDRTRSVRGPNGEKHRLSGLASWYGEDFHGRTTASGLPYDMYQFTAAHKTLPFHTIVRVIDPHTLKSVVVQITDRGPYADGRIIDLSYAAAADLGLVRRGVGHVELEILRWGDGSYRQ